jgi:SAM-dependent methyltransferase
LGAYDDYAADEQLHRDNARRRLARIAKHRGALTPRSLLDIGCAYGYALDEARAAGWAAVGVEPSPEASFRARASGLPVFSDVAAATSAHPEGFDVVCLCQVLSHVPDPLSTVASAAKSLKPGGLLFIETWRRDAWPARIAGPHWHVIVPPTVVWLETSRSIRSLLDRVGLEVVDWTRGRKKVSAGLVSSLLGTAPLPGALVGAARRVGQSRWARAAVRYPFDDLVWVTAEAPG